MSLTRAHAWQRAMRTGRTRIWVKVEKCCQVAVLVDAEEADRWVPDWHLPVRSLKGRVENAVDQLRREKAVTASPPGHTVAQHADMLYEANTFHLKH